MSQLVLSWTATLVLSGTRSSCYWGPESDLRACFCALSSRNFTNQKSFGFVLTDRTEGHVGVRQRHSDSLACLCRPYTRSTESQAHGYQLQRRRAAA